MKINRHYSDSLFNAINKMEKECSIDDYDQRRHIENMRVEYFGLINNGVIETTRHQDYIRKKPSITKVKYISNERN